MATKPGESDAPIERRDQRGPYDKKPLPQR